MQDDCFEEIRKGIGELSDRMGVLENSMYAIQSQMKILIRQKMSNKQEKLMDEVMRSGKMNVKQVETYLGISRPHSLNLMDKLGMQLGFIYRVGNKATRTPSIILYSKSRVVADQNKKIMSLIREKQIVKLADIMSLFGSQLDEAKVLAENFIAMNKGYRLDENKLVKSNETIN